MQNRLCKDVEKQKSCKIVACDYYDIRMELNCSYSIDNSKCIKENVMKPQFTEEEFEVVYTFFMGISWNDDFKTTLQLAKDKGIIRKSDLEILIEEAEEMWEKCRGVDKTIMEYKQRECITKLKAELNKRRDI